MNSKIFLTLKHFKQKVFNFSTIETRVIKYLILINQQQSHAITMLSLADPS